MPEGLTVWSALVCKAVWQGLHYLYEKQLYKESAFETRFLLLRLSHTQDTGSRPAKYGC